MITKADIKRWADENRIPGFQSAYSVVNAGIENTATYQRGGIYHGKPAVIPTKHEAAKMVRDYWIHKPASEFNQQAVHVASHLVDYYRNRGI